MGKTAQLIMGPAGSGKTTYCKNIQDYFDGIKRPCNLVNLDPAASDFLYKPAIDIKDLITLEDVIEELGFGPNGGLLYIFEYLVENIDWLEEQIQDYEDDNLIIDCPGQIELYTHSDSMRKIVKCFERNGYAMCGIYLLDSLFALELIRAMSSMLQLGIAHINVMTKMDLVSEDQLEHLERFLNVDTSLLLEESTKETASKYHLLNRALVQLIDEYSMVQYVPINYKDEESIERLIMIVDRAVQYGEDLEPKEIKEDIDDDY